MKNKVIRFEPDSTQAKAVISFVRQRDEFTRSLQKKAKEIQPVVGVFTAPLQLAYHIHRHLQPVVGVFTAPLQLAYRIHQHLTY